MEGRTFVNIFGSFMLCMILWTSCSDKSGDAPSPNKNSSHIYFVATDGSDSNVGSFQSPFKSINKALNNIVPGDTILVRGGSYYDKVTLTKSGTVDKLITIKAYRNEKPIIDGSYMQITGYWDGLITFSKARFITLEGLDICNVTTSTPHVDPEGIVIKDGCNNITIKRCSIYNIQNNTTLNDWRSAHAIVVLGNSDTETTKNITIDGCTIHDTKTGTSETLTIAGNVDGFTLSNNKIYDIENIGIIIAGGDNLIPHGNVALNYARNGVISGNELYNNTHLRSPEVWGATSYGAIAIYVCGGANVIIEKNKVHDSDRGIGLVSESNIYPTKNCIVRNNFVYNCWRTGIYMGDYLNYTSQGTNNCYVVNNTLLFNNAVKGAFGEIEGEIRLTENCINNVIKNNLIYARPVDVFIHKYTTTGSNNDIDYNLYYTTGTPSWLWNTTNGTGNSNLKDWQAASNCDAHSVYGTDPLLRSITLPDLHIQDSSPAKNSGIFISTDINGTVDIDGNPRTSDNKISKGAHQL
ncbi:MAG: right-handed parallel beta-helix repeat-containing protein [Bacteroidota bacterium]|nr:right-handed parallel beta-helix repeat-containing protein [Bacteroidota bacterium]